MYVLPSSTSSSTLLFIVLRAENESVNLGCGLVPSDTGAACCSSQTWAPEDASSPKACWNEETELADFVLNELSMSASVTCTFFWIHKSNHKSESDEKWKQVWTAATYQDGQRSQEDLFLVAIQVWLVEVCGQFGRRRSEDLKLLWLLALIRWHVLGIWLDWFGCWWLRQRSALFGIVGFWEFWLEYWVICIVFITFG